jgi:hypothetical protein
VFVSTLAILAHQFFQLREPEYAGRSLSSWLSIHQYPAKYQAEIAIKHIGTNAFPVLIGWLASSTEGPMKTKLIQFLEAHPKVSIHVERAERKRIKALRTFQILGPMAKPAVPALINLFTHAEDEGIKMGVAMSLAEIGPDAREASPALIDYIHNYHGSRFGFSDWAVIASCLTTIDPEAAAREGVK